jgi:hypothetical protein
LEAVTTLELVAEGQAETISDEEVVLLVLRTREYESAARDARKSAEKELEKRLRARSGRAIEVDDLVASLGPGSRTEYDYPTLLRLREVAEDFEILEAAMMNPSGGFFEALTDKYDAAKKIIADARIEVPGDEKLRIKKRKRGKGASE